MNILICSCTGNIEERPEAVLPEKLLQELSAFSALPWSGSDIRRCSYQNFSADGRVFPVISIFDRKSGRVVHLIFDDRKELQKWSGGAPGVLSCCPDEIFSLGKNFRFVPDGFDIFPAAAGQWRYFFGDAGWAGVVSSRLYHAPGSEIYLERNAKLSQEDLLDLLLEVALLLPPERRAQFTFVTDSGLCRKGCFFCVLESGTALADRVRQEHPSDLISACIRTPLPESPESAPWINAARTGGILPGEGGRDGVSSERLKSFVRLLILLLLMIFAALFFWFFFKKQMPEKPVSNLELTSPAAVEQL